MLKKVLTWAGIALVIWYLATDANGAAGIVTGALHWLGQAGDAMSRWLNSIHL